MEPGSLAAFQVERLGDAVENGMTMKRRGKRWRTLVGLAVASASGIACGGSGVPNERPVDQQTAPQRPVGPLVYVTNEGSGNLSIIDALSQEVVTTVQLGKRPRGIRMTPDGKLLYIALSGSPPAPPGVDPKTLPPPDRSADGIGEVDTVTNRLVRIIHAGVDPEDLDISIDGSRIYVANEEHAQLSVVDVKSASIVATVPIGEEPEGVTIRPDGRIVYVTCEGDNAVFAIDTGTNKVLRRIEVGPRPRAVGFLPDGSRAYVSLENNGSVAVIDGLKHELVQTIELNGEGATPRPRPMGIAVRPDGSMVYVTTGSFGSLFLVDPVRNEAVASIAVGQRPWGLALTPDGRTVYTANGPSNDVSVVDVVTRQVIKKIRVGDRPWGVVTQRPPARP